MAYFIGPFDHDEILELREYCNDENLKIEFKKDDGEFDDLPLWRVTGSAEDLQTLKRDMAIDFRGMSYDGGDIKEGLTLNLLKAIVNEGGVKQAASDLIHQAAELVPNTGDKEEFLMKVVAKVLELDTNQLFKGDFKVADEMVRAELGDNDEDHPVTKTIH